MRPPVVVWSNTFPVLAAAGCCCCCCCCSSLAGPCNCPPGTPVMVRAPAVGGCMLASAVGLFSKGKRAHLQVFSRRGFAADRGQSADQENQPDLQLQLMYKRQCVTSGRFSRRGSPSNHFVCCLALLVAVPVLA